MQWLGLGVALVIGVALGMKWFAYASPTQVFRAIRVAAVILALLVLLALVLLGRLPWLVGLAGWSVLMIPAILAIRAQSRRDAAARGPRAGRASQVRTRFLDMRLDHDSGELDGRVVAGTYEGRMLSSMSLQELRGLLSEASEDADTMNVLAAFLDRTHGDSWRTAGDRESGGAGGAGGPMTRDEAARILGISPDASADEIRTAHRRLMKQLHPDHGGTDYLAAKINEAKDVLLGR